MNTFGSSNENTLYQRYGSTLEQFMGNVGQLSSTQVGDSTSCKMKILDIANRLFAGVFDSWKNCALNTQVFANLLALKDYYWILELNEADLLSNMPGYKQGFVSYRKKVALKLLQEWSAKRFDVAQIGPCPESLMKLGFSAVDDVLGIGGGGDGATGSIGMQVEPPPQPAASSSTSYFPSPSPPPATLDIPVAPLPSVPLPTPVQPTVPPPLPLHLPINPTASTSAFPSSPKSPIFLGPRSPSSLSEPAQQAIWHVQQAIASLRLQNSSNALLHIKCCCDFVADLSNKTVHMPPTDLTSVPESSSRAKLWLRLVATSVRDNQIDHAIYYISQIGS